jgi:protein-L-isoaspartate O-methyltransferase
MEKGQKITTVPAGLGYKTTVVSLWFNANLTIFQLYRGG